MYPQVRQTAFTLAELLIALAILGVIASYTIPKVLMAQQGAKNAAIVKEALAMFSETYFVFQRTNLSTADVGPSDLTPYMNYVAQDITSSIDNPYGQTGSRTCTNVHPCLILHNGAKVYFDTGNTFGGTSATNYIYMNIDPDGGVTGSATTDGPGKAFDLIVYFNGKTTLMVYCQTGDATSLWGAVQTWCPGDPTSIPAWFTW